MAFSSRITPHSVQTEAPEAPCNSMCVDPQLGQARPDSAIVDYYVCLFQVNAIDENYSLLISSTICCNFADDERV